MQRFNDWSERLQVYLDRVKDEPFKWGTHDCIQFTCTAVKVITGHDFLHGITGTYSTKLEAAKWLRDNGFGTLTGALTETFGQPVHPALAGRGDIVVFGKAAGIAVSHNWAWFVGEVQIGTREDGSPIMQSGLIQQPTLNCDFAFKIAAVPRG